MENRFYLSDSSVVLAWAESSSIINQGFGVSLRVHDFPEIPQERQGKTMGVVVGSVDVPAA